MTCERQRALCRAQNKARCVITRVGQNRIYTPYMTVYDRIFGDFPAKITEYIHRI